jgi:hypothetical protein
MIATRRSTFTFSSISSQRKYLRASSGCDSGSTPDLKIWLGEQAKKVREGNVKRRRWRDRAGRVRPGRERAGHLTFFAAALFAPIPLA